jgi:hypothetical protein
LGSDACLTRSKGSDLSWTRSFAVALAACCAAAAPAQAADTDFSDWAAVVVAGDFHAHSGGPTEAFDNARRDVASALVAAGFTAGNIVQLSVRPERYPDARPGQSDLLGVAQGLAYAAGKAPGGCLLYLTSHGAPQGALVGEEVMSPRFAAKMVDNACGKRPTVVVISACYSGVFVPFLAKPNRMVLTAARPDRSSFGCGESDTYPYFDACVLESLPKVKAFPALGRAAQSCVAQREQAERLTPASEPQMSVGGELALTLPLLTFAGR